MSRQGSDDPAHKQSFPRAYTANNGRRIDED